MPESLATQSDSPTTENAPKLRYAGNPLVLFGGIGAGIVALCCFTPLLVWALFALGFAGLVAYIDVVLLPVLALALVALYFGVRQVQRARSACDDRCAKPKLPAPEKPPDTQQG